MKEKLANSKKIVFRLENDGEKGMQLEHVMKEAEQFEKTNCLIWQLNFGYGIIWQKKQTAKCLI